MMPPEDTIVLPPVEDAPEPKSKAKVKPKAVVRAKGKKDTVARLLAAINRAKPRGGNDKPSFDVSRFGDVQSRVKYVLKTGIDSFDELTGSIPFGRITEIYGGEGCLDADTHVAYNVVMPGEPTKKSPNGSTANC